MKTIFILEDSKTDAHRLAALLEANGYEVIGFAESAAEAIERVPQLKPDLMFVDVILKDRKMDGVDAAVEIRRRLEIPVVFVTNYSEERFVERALKVSPYAYMLKPINEDQLRVTLETIRGRLALEKEKEELVEQLFQSQKMEAIGQLAGGMAHNYSNMLSVILGNAELAIRNMTEDDANYGRVSKIVKSGKRAKDLTHKLLTLTRKEEMRFVSADINRVIEEALDIFSVSMPRMIELRTDLDEGLGEVQIDAMKITQAILNICNNACAAMPDGGTLVVSSRKATRDEELRREKSGLKPAACNLIRIHDSGCGIPEEIRGRIFDPFFSTQEKEMGTGLGLFVTLNIIKRHDGFIEVQSETGKGTTVDILLPEAAPAPAQEGAARRKAKDAGTETILIVDDEADFLDMMTETLQICGYRTFATNSGSKAVELYRERHAEIDLVLLDIIMPEMDGGKVFRALKEIAPDVKVVLCSGYSREVNVDDLMKEGIAAFIQKPFGVPKLESLLSNVLAT